LGADPRLKIFFDGGCRPNPGPLEIAVVAAGRTIILRDLGCGTSSDAEWLALIHALTVARSLGAANFVLIGDAADIVAKASGSMKCRGADTAHLQRFRSLVSAGPPPRVRYVKRSQNLAGIALTRLHAR
jgi:ribonuclease HI